ncbi:MAG: DMT family transporter [Xanthomonadaceae bacterium]|nr:DMT family transporter [Xanthomonadaceae bacterium]
MSSPGLRLWLLVAAAMLAFAGNSVLCRLALRDGGIDAASFTSLRLVSGALVLWLIVRLRGGARTGGDMLSAFALFVYAAGFSFAYLSLSTGTGALILFGAVQATMIGRGLISGERLSPVQWCGLALAMAGLVGLLLPGVSAPPVVGALLMLAAGIAWGAYSLRGRGAGDAIAKTAGNFLRAVPFALVLSVIMLRDVHADAIGIACALVSGALTSGIGYAVWYTALPQLRATSAATVQLSVPALAAIAGIALLGEPPTWRLALATLAILGGIAMVVRVRSRARD